MSSSTVTYSDIGHLVCDLEVDKRQQIVRCSFQCPVTGVVVKSTGRISEGTGFTDRIVDSTVRSFKWRIRSSIYRAVRSFFGRSFLGTVAADAATDMVYRPNSYEQFYVSSEETQAAVLRAFQAVKGRFVHGPHGWVAVQAKQSFQSEFLERLSRFPVSTRYEKAVADKLLNHLAMLGGIRREEVDFLAEFGGKNASCPEAPSRAELLEVESSARESIISLCWALVMVDGEMSRQETDSLWSVARDFGLSEGTFEELRREAAEFVVWRALNEADSTTEERDAAALAIALALDPEYFERLKIRVRKSRGDY
jgi:Tellurite resistance protein TerB